MIKGNKNLNTHLHKGSSLSYIHQKHYYILVQGKLDLKNKGWKIFINLVLITKGNIPIMDSKVVKTVA